MRPRAARTPRSTLAGTRVGGYRRGTQRPTRHHTRVPTVRRVPGFTLLLITLITSSTLRTSFLDTALMRHAKVEIPLICGAMYPCSNPELVAAVSDAGGLGIVQPVSLTFVHGHD